MSNQWQHGLCGCFDNCGLCIITYFVPCYTFGKNAEAVGDSCLLCGLIMMVPVANLIAGIMERGKIREKQGIEGSMLGDIAVWWCCPLCALVQEGQECATMSGGQSIERE